MPNSSPRRSTTAAASSADCDFDPPDRSMGIMPMAGNRYFVFHESMYSDLPTKLMLRGTVSIRKAESRNEMWFGHRIAGPSAGRRSYPLASIFHSRRVTGPTMPRKRSWALPAPTAVVMAGDGTPPVLRQFARHVIGR